jgi:ABC-type polysaccharide/polyol phosphate export permease
MMSGRFQRLWEVALLLVQRDFRGRYKHTHVGMLWSIINPLMFLLIFYFLFKIVLNIGIPRYASFVFTGIVVWTWLQAGLMQAVTSISSNPGLVSQPDFPIAALPIVSTASAFLNMALSFPLLIVILAVEGARPSLALLALPLLLIAQLLLILSLAYLVAAFNVAFRDVEHALPILLQLGYYESGCKSIDRESMIRIPG